MNDPYRNLPRAIYIALPLVTVIFELTNVSLAVLTPASNMLSSDAIAVIFSNRMFGYWAQSCPL